MTGFNPYAPPSAETDGQAPVLASGDPLFTENQVAGATFLGSPLAGFIVMAINERRLGRPEGQAKMIGFGVVATLVVLGISLVLPAEFPGFALTIAYLFGMQQLARVWQGTEIADRMSRGTPKASNWVVFGIGMAGFVMIIAIVAGLFAPNPAMFE